MKRNFGRDWKGGCKHKKGYENERAPDNLWIIHSPYFVLKIELLMTVLPNFEREAGLKDR